MNTTIIPRLRGLYAITDPQLTPATQVLSAAEAALRGGARVLQYRDKHANPATRQHYAVMLKQLCQHFDALFIVNDDVALAEASNADGVHLGQNDGDIATARARLSAHRLIGVSCHGDLGLATKAVAAGADYLAFGRFFDSHTKPEAPSADIAVLREARRRFAQPLVAIGGVTPDNSPLLIEAGADAVAAIHGLFGTSDVETAARRYCAAFDNRDSNKEHS